MAPGQVLLLEIDSRIIISTASIELSGKLAELIQGERGGTLRRLVDCREPARTQVAGNEVK